MQAHPLGQRAAIIGTVVDDPHHFVQMKTRFGGKRIVGQWLGPLNPQCPDFSGIVADRPEPAQLSGKRRA